MIRSPNAKPGRRIRSSHVTRALVCATLVAAGALTALVGFAPRPVSAAIQTGDCTPSSSWPADNSSLASQVMSLINQHRAGLGEGQLVTSPTLTASAVWKAEHMANFNYFEHDDPGPPTTTTPARTFADRLQTCGYPYGAGENIAEGFPDAQSVVNAWLNSAGHKANIENSAYVATGLGVAEASNGAIYWVQDFGVVADSGSPPPPPPTTTSAPPPPTTTVATTTTTTTTPTTTSKGGGTGTTTTTQSSAGGGTSAATPKPLRLSDAKLQVGSRTLVLATTVSAGATSPKGANVKCAAHVGLRNLRVVVNAYRGRLARCSWRLPAHLVHGAVARGWVSVRSGGLRARVSFSLVVRPD